MAPLFHIVRHRRRAAQRYVGRKVKPFEAFAYVTTRNYEHSIQDMSELWRH